ncbi:hypothetical protein [Polynucleobacter necessarius]|uniref:hypothetical protein n=1 Tax=Polynucleobacter necessarius TaxID=576610 RepID=UPI0013B05555|nr:hypothetical protein [Polynucleobacter necessarius]
MTQLHDVKTVKVNGVDVAYRFDGPENGPVLLVANSLMANGSMWDGNVAALADRYRILRYDKRSWCIRRERWSLHYCSIDR